MPNFTANIAISTNSIKIGSKGRLDFLASSLPIFLRSGSVVNFRNFFIEKLTGINTTNATTPPTATPIRTSGQLFP